MKKLLFLITISLLSVFLLFSVSDVAVAACTPKAPNVSVGAYLPEAELEDTKTYNIRIKNTEGGDCPDRTYYLTGNMKGGESGWEISFDPNNLTLSQKITGTSIMSVTSPEDAVRGESYFIEVTVTQGSWVVEEEVEYKVIDCNFSSPKPTVTIDPSFHTGGIGIEKQYNVEVTNNYNCDYTFEAPWVTENVWIDGGEPAQVWPISFTPSSLFLPSGEKDNFIVSTTPPAGTADGSYEVKMIVRSKGATADYIVGIVPTKTCAQLNGTCCPGGKICTSGKITGASDCTECCSNVANCKTPDTKTCAQLNGTCCPGGKICTSGKITGASDCTECCSNIANCKTKETSSVVGIGFENPLKYDDFGELVDGIVDFIFNIAIVIVPLAIVIGAFFLLISGGDPEKIKTGKSIILYSLIGLVIVLFAKGLIAMIEDILKVEIGG